MTNREEGNSKSLNIHIPFSPVQSVHNFLQLHMGTVKPMNQVHANHSLPKTTDFFAAMYPITNARSLPQGHEGKLPEVGRVVVVDRIDRDQGRRVVDVDRRRAVCRQLQIAPLVEHAADQLLVCD